MICFDLKKEAAAVFPVLILISFQFSQYLIFLFTGLLLLHAQCSPVFLLQNALVVHTAIIHSHLKLLLKGFVSGVYFSILFSLAIPFHFPARSCVLLGQTFLSYV